MIARTFPHNLEAEQGVLGSMLYGGHVIAECAERITADHFFSKPHQTIFLQIIEAWKEGQPTDLITFTEWLGKRKLLESVGGAGMVTGLFTFVPTAANVAYYLEIVIEKYKARQIIATCTELSRRAFEEQDDIEGLYSEAQATLLRFASMAGGKTRAVSMRENVSLAIERAEAVTMGTLPPALMTGLKDLDDKLGGLHDGEMIVVTGDSGGGKTSLSHNICAHVAIQLKKTVQIFSYEMNALTVTNRLIASIGGINTENIRRGKLTEGDYAAFQRAATQLSAANIFIDDDVNTTLTQLQAKARKLKASHDTALIVVDLIGKIPSSGKATNSRQRDVAENSDGIQKLAMELGIPIIVLSQVNEEGKVREARDVVHDAKTLLKIIREDNDPIEEEPLIAPRKIVIAKNNSGAVGTVNALFNKPFVRFEGIRHDAVRAR